MLKTEPIEQLNFLALFPSQNTSNLFHSNVDIILTALTVLLLLVLSILLLHKQTALKRTMVKINQLNNDINDRTKNLERALQKAEESNRLKSLFLSNMSHEIRTPLNSILGFSELLAENNIPGNQKKMYAEQVIHNGQNLLKLIDQIFHLAIFETGKISIKKETFKINDLFKKLEVKTQQKIDHSKKLIRLSFNIENENFEIYTDKLKLKLIINNLLDNALKFTSKGIIDVSCYLTENYYIFQITDSGCGLKEDEYEIIFDPFAQGTETISKIKGGSGLGLSNVKNYIILLGGKVWCTKNNPNGSIFYFSLPAIMQNEATNNDKLNFSFYKN
ncbi:MAG: HAMP domain-containing histidine kinase [Prolixibacteraceae bacterium]|jgi:signal transduction histidine kinase|nr:HAMP domain-containing histidine kinase [Prolixibacteraceae bacterium]